MRKKIKNKFLEDIRFGIEIEVEFPQVKDSYGLIEKNRLIRGWEMDFDGSLENGAEYRPKDKNHLYFNEDCIDQIKEIIGLIKAHKGNIRPTCGLHIHIDTKTFTREEIVNITKTFYNHQDKIYKDFKVIKSRESHNAKKLNKRMVASLTPSKITAIAKGRTAFKEDMFQDRDFGLNLYAMAIHGTIEFRFFNGTIQPRNIKSNIKWAIEFCLSNAKNGNEKRKRR